MDEKKCPIDVFSQHKNIHLRASEWISCLDLVQRLLIKFMYLMHFLDVSLLKKFWFGA